MDGLYFMNCSMANFKRKSDPSIKVSRIRSDLRLMVEMGKLDKETEQEIEKALSLDYIEQEWNKPPVWKQMMRDLIAFMEDYQIHLYFPPLSEVSIYWGNWSDSLHLHDMAIMFDVKAAKELPKLYKQAKLLDKQLEQYKDVLDRRQLVTLLKDARNYRFPGRERSADKDLEEYIDNLYKAIREAENDDERESKIRMVEWLEQLVTLRAKFEYSQKVRHAMEIRNQIPEVLSKFEELLLESYPDKEIIIFDLRKAHTSAKDTIEDLKHVLFPEVVEYLEDKGWKLIELVNGKKMPMRLNQ